ncbi:MAG: hypothetical protein K0R18_1525, partial [Bacillales bacterium]|nr:hypothetical protein [Bacillales bacterium]
MKSNKIVLSIFLSAFLIFGQFLSIDFGLLTPKVAHAENNGNWYQFAASSFAGGDGSQSDPYQIATSEQLAHLFDIVTGASNGWENGQSQSG